MPEPRLDRLEEKRPRLEESQLRGAFSMEEDSLVWRALMQVFDGAEQAAVELSQEARFVPNECTIAAAEAYAVATVRKRIEGLNGMLKQEEMSRLRST